MTGVGGRPELIIEGHANYRLAKDGWLAYDFLYKPGNVSEAPPVVGGCLFVSSISLSIFHCPSSYSIFILSQGIPPFHF